MELVVGGGGRKPVAGQSCFVMPLLHRLHSADVAERCLLAELPRQHRLNGFTNLEHVDEALTIDAADLGAAIGIDLDEPLALQQLERLAHRLNADLAPLGDSLEPQPPPRWNVAVENLLTEPRRDAAVSGTLINGG